MNPIEGAAKQCAAAAPVPKPRRIVRGALRIVRAIADRGRNASSILLFAIGTLLVAGITWASVAQLDEVIRGEGKVVPSQQLQVVQSLEGGIVRRLYVREGDVVRAGAPLIELDPTLHRSQYDQALQQWRAERARAARLEAEAQSSRLQMPPDLVQDAPMQVAAETSLYIGRQQEVRTQLGELREQLAQREQELAGSEATLAGTARAAALARQSRDVIKRLVDKGLEAELNLIAEETKVNDLENKLAVTQAEISRLRATIQEVHEKVGTVESRFRSSALADLAQSRGKLSELDAQLAGLRDRVERTTLVAPVAGVVNRLHVKTLGGVAQAAETLVEIVPGEDALLVEAYVKPADIAFVHAGQAARVKLTAYDSSRYGGLDGQIVKVSADAVRNPDAPQGRADPSAGGAADVYLVTVKTGAAQLRQNGRLLTIIPGMKAEVDIVTGKRTVLDYLVHPVVKVSDRAFRESPH